MADKDIENGKVCAILSYLLIGIIWYFVDDNMKKNAFAKFHAKQGIGLFIAWVAVVIVTFIFAFIPIIGWIVNFLLGIGLFVLWLIGIINSATGKTNALPIIGGVAESLKI